MIILIATAHPDDVELCMGGTLAKLVQRQYDIDDEITILLHIFSYSDTIPGNDNIAEELSKSVAGVYGLDRTVYKFPTMHFNEHNQEIRDRLFQVKQNTHPDVVYCTSPNALNPDHIVIGKACESMFFESTIYGMEGIRDGHNQKINKWEKIELEHLETKLDALSQYKSQSEKGYFKRGVILGHASYRGAQIGVPFAEGFEVIREVS